MYLMYTLILVELIFNYECILVLETNLNPIKYLESYQYKYMLIIHLLDMNCMIEYIYHGICI